MRSTVASMIISSVLAFPLLAALSDGLEPIEPEHAQRFGKLLSDEADKIEKPQVKITADPDKASGVHVPHKVGVLIVPQKGLQLGEELSAKLKQEKGASVAYLFLYHLTPVINGNAIDSNRLRSVKLAGDNGQEISVSVLLLAARQLSEDDYRLYAYGYDDKPLIDAKFAEGTGPGPEPTAVEIKEVDEQTQRGKLVVTVFGKYQASFSVGHRAE